MYVEGHPDAGEIDRLFRFLTRPGPSFGLAVAVFADWVLAAAARHRLNQQLHDQGRREAVTLELHYDKDQAQDLVQRMIDASVGTDALFVVGLDRFVVDEFGKPRPTSSIANLNQRRDHLPELLHTRVVFWVPKSAWSALTEFAWDLCQVFMTTAEFEAVRQMEIDAIRAEAPPEWLQLATTEEVPQLEQQLEALLRVHATATSPRAVGDAAASVAEMEIRLGHMASARTWVERASHEHEQAGQLDEAARWARRAAEMALFAGDLEQARCHAERALELARSGGHEREAALAQALLAEHDARHGEVERAIAQLEDQVLPTLVRLGDDAAQAGVLGKLADFREMRGEADEALALRENQIAPLHARVRAASGPAPAAQAANVTRIAESYVRKGKLEEAQQLTMAAPSREATNTLAVIAQARGDTDTAALLRERASASNEDDPAARARALGGRAEQLAGAGKLAEALRVREDEELPIYEQLGDLRAQVVTLGETADLLSALGRTDEAIDTLEHRMRPLARRLGDAWLLNRAADKLLALLRSREDEHSDSFGGSGSGSGRVAGKKSRVHRPLSTRPPSAMPAAASAPAPTGGFHVVMDEGGLADAPADDADDDVKSRPVGKSGSSMVGGNRPTETSRAEAPLQRRGGFGVALTLLGIVIGAAAVVVLGPLEYGPKEEPPDMRGSAEFGDGETTSTPETAPFVSENAACEVLTRNGEAKTLERIPTDERRKVGSHTIACTSEGEGQRAVIELPSDAFHVFPWPPAAGLTCADVSACYQLYLGCDEEFVCDERGDVGCMQGKCEPRPEMVVGDCDFEHPPTRIGAPIGDLDDVGSGRSCGVVETALGDTSSSMRLMGLSGGEFTMGSEDGDEAPRHRVAISRFAMCETEVNIAQYAAVTGKRQSKCRYGCRDEDPVHGVTWEDAARFMNELTVRENARRTEGQLTLCYDEATWAWDQTCTGYRLPTEAEWEYAARAGSTADYSFGDGVGELCEHGHVGGCPGDREVVSVTARRPNQWELFGMHGNVWEWVADMYTSKFYPMSPPVDPFYERRGDAEADRVRRGGSFNSAGALCRSANRDHQPPSTVDQVNGFRCARGARP